LSYDYNQGKPFGKNVISDPGVITYLQDGKQKIYVFVRGEDNNLYVNWWNGSAWTWTDQGKPFGKNVISDPDVITYLQDGKQKIYVFVRASDNNLYVNWWSGSAWKWTNQGKPS
jgi:hypothetical protein